MPLRSVFGKALWDMRWQLFWYGVGMAAMAAFVVYVYPSYSEQLKDFEIPEALRAFVGEVADFSSPEGFVSAEFFSWMPILLTIFAIMQGTSALAGEEANGTLDLLLAQPLSRVRVVVEKVGAFVIGCFVIAAVGCLGWLASMPFVDIDLSLLKTVAATFTLVPVTLTFGAFSMWAGAALPNRRVATGLVAAVAVATYFVNYLAALVDALRPLRWASPFHYSSSASVLTTGTDWPKTAVLIGLFALFTALTLIAFQRRDIGVRTEYSLRRLAWRRRARNGDIAREHR